MMKCFHLHLFPYLTVQKIQSIQNLKILFGKEFQMCIKIGKLNLLIKKDFSNFKKESLKVVLYIQLYYL